MPSRIYTMLLLTSHIVSYHVFIHTLDTPAHLPIVFAPIVFFTASRGWSECVLVQKTYPSVGATHASQFSSRAIESRMRTVVLLTTASATGPTSHLNPGDVRMQN